VVPESELKPRFLKKKQNKTKQKVGAKWKINYHIYSKLSGLIFHPKNQFKNVSRFQNFKENFQIFRSSSSSLAELFILQISASWGGKKKRSALIQRLFIWKKLAQNREGFSNVTKI
jgi:hypothetical protein